MEMTEKQRVGIKLIGPEMICNLKHDHYSDRRTCQIIISNHIRYACNPETSTFLSEVHLASKYYHMQNMLLRIQSGRYKGIFLHRYLQ
jgi:hypothetical protein